MPPRAAVAAAAAAAAAALLLPLGLAPQCRDDEVWRFNGVSSCAEFADNPGAAFCAESWATGADSETADQVHNNLATTECPLLVSSFEPAPGR